MNKVMVFNYCSIPVLLIVLLTTFIRKTTKGMSNRLFIGIFSSALFTGIIDIFADGYEAFLPLILSTLIYFLLARLITLLIDALLKRISPKRHSADAGGEKK